MFGGELPVGGGAASPVAGYSTVVFLIVLNGAPWERPLGVFTTSFVGGLPLWVGRIFPLPLRRRVFRLGRLNFRGCPLLRGPFFCGTLTLVHWGKGWVGLVYRDCFL